MKAEMLKRLVRAIAKGSQDDLDRLADLIVESERKSGHSRLAGELESILDDKSKKKSSNRAGIDSDRTIRELPISRRHREMLVSFIPHDALEYHIVLRHDIDERFERIAIHLHAHGKAVRQ